MTREEQYISWIDSAISQNKAHHNHKENRAWVTIVFYWTAIVLFSVNAPNTLSPTLLGVFSIILFIATSGVLLMVQAHLGLCRDADREIAAMNSIRVELINNPQLLDEPNEEIKATPVKPPVDIPFPDLLRYVGEDFKKHETPARDQLELASKILVWSGFVVALLLLFGPTIVNVARDLRYSEAVLAQARWILNTAFRAVALLF